jgi:hypothetical protein
MGGRLSVISYNAVAHACARAAAGASADKILEGLHLNQVTYKDMYKYFNMSVGDLEGLHLIQVPRTPDLRPLEPRPPNHPPPKPRRLDASGAGRRALEPRPLTASGHCEGAGRGPDGRSGACVAVGGP